jgi:hypothetical protein
MQEDQLLKDLENTSYGKATAKNLQANGITSYSQIFDLLKNENSDLTLRKEACSAVFALYKTVDKRRAVPPLLIALKSHDEVLRSDAANALGQVNSRRAVEPLIELACDKTQPEMVRVMAIQGLDGIGDKRAVLPLTQIMFDQSDDLRIRTQAVEWTSEFTDGRSFENYVVLLSDPSPDIRFWAAFGLTWLTNWTDITPALEKLDEIVAFDHILPTLWGWHVDREALRALEIIHYRQVTRQSFDEKLAFRSLHATYLISPAPEYITLDWRYRKWNENGFYTTDTLPEIKLMIDPELLAKKLTEKWPEIKLNVREPHTQAYLLDWHLQIDGSDMIGGLHRDQYGVVITGGKETIIPFSAWYRELFPTSQPLYLYQWAEPHVELKANATATELKKTLYGSPPSADKVKTEPLIFR